MNWRLETRCCKAANMTRFVTRRHTNRLRFNERNRCKSEARLALRWLLRLALDCWYLRKCYNNTLKEGCCRVPSMEKLDSGNATLPDEHSLVAEERAGDNFPFTKSPRFARVHAHVCSAQAQRFASFRFLVPAVHASLQHVVCRGQQVLVAQGHEGHSTNARLLQQGKHSAALN